MSQDKPNYYDVRTNRIGLFLYEKTTHLQCGEYLILIVILSLCAWTVCKINIV